jgi:hypothetical protein
MCYVKHGVLKQLVDLYDHSLITYLKSFSLLIVNSFANLDGFCYIYVPSV